MCNWERLGFLSEDDEREEYEEFLNINRENTTIPVDAVIERFNLSTRTYNALIGAGITTVGDVCWHITCLGDKWGRHIRNFGETSKKEAEDVLLSEETPFVDTIDLKKRIDYLIKLLKSNRKLSGRQRCEIANYLQELLSV